MAEYTAYREAAILRTLRDIECGHINLRCSVRRFNEQTGERLTEPELIETGSDRAPAAGFPWTPLGRWWEPLAERGWLRLPTEAEPPCWQVTDEGRRVLTETNKSNDKE